MEFDALSFFGRSRPPIDEATGETNWMFDPTIYESGLGKTTTPTSVIVKWFEIKPEGPTWQAMLGESLLIKKSATILLLLLGIVLIVVGMRENSWPVALLGALSLLGGVILLLLKDCGAQSKQSALRAALKAWLDAVAIHDKGVGHAKAFLADMAACGPGRKPSPPPCPAKILCYSSC